MGCCILGLNVGSEMVTSNKMLKLIAATDEEVEKIVMKMTEDDAKQLLVVIIQQMNKERKEHE